MKMAIVASCCIIAFTASATELTTSTGKKYTGVRISRSDATSVTFMHSGGVVTIPFQELPSDIRKQYDPRYRTETNAAPANITPEAAVTEDEARVLDIVNSIRSNKPVSTNDIAYLEQVGKLRQLQIDRAFQVYQQARDAWFKDMDNRLNKTAADKAQETWQAKMRHARTVLYSIHLNSLAPEERAAQIAKDDEFMSQARLLRDDTYFIKGIAFQIAEEGIIVTDAEFGKADIDEEGENTMKTPEMVNYGRNLFLYTDTAKFVDGDKVFERAFPFGTYSYISVQGAPIKLSAFTTDQKKAAERIGKGRPTTPPTVPEPVAGSVR